MELIKCLESINIEISIGWEFIAVGSEGRTCVSSNTVKRKIFLSELNLYFSKVVAESILFSAEGIVDIVAREKPEKNGLERIEWVI